MGMTRRRFATMAGASAAATMLTTGHHRSFAQDDRPILRFGANASDVFNLDPHFSTTYQDWMVRDMVFNGLLRYVPGNALAFEPDLAAEMPTATENDDGTQTWTFTLRDDVIVHPSPVTESYALTSDDVVFSLRKSGNPETSGFFQDYKDWTIDAVDDVTVTITLPAPQTESLFFPRVANYLCGHIVPRQPYEALGADAFILQPVGTGPFRFESHTPQNNVLLLAHDEYFRGQPGLGGVELRFIADPTSRDLALQSNDIQLSHGIMDAAWVSRFDDNPDLTADVFGAGDVLIMNLDTKHEILQDRRVREAILLSVSRRAHAHFAGDQISKLVYSVAPYDSVAGGLTQEEAAEAGVEYAQDLDRAQELLTEAGYPDGFELSLVSSEIPVYRTHYEMLAEELRQVGITVSLEIVQHAAMHELIREDRNAIVFYLAFRPSVDYYLNHFYSSESGVLNFPNIEMDDLRDQARAESDPDRQEAIWKEAMLELARECAAVGLLYNRNVFARSNAFDYGYDLESTFLAYPPITEKATLTLP